MFKMLSITSRLHHIRNHIEGCFERAAHEKFGGRPFEIVVPLANSPQRVHFAPDEIAMLFSLGEYDVLNDVISPDQAHNAIADSFEGYCRRREEFSTDLPTSMSGAKATTYLTQEQVLTLAPKMYELDSLMTSLRILVVSHAAESSDVAARLSQLSK